MTPLPQTDMSRFPKNGGQGGRPRKSGNVLKTVNEITGKIITEGCKQNDIPGGLREIEDPVGIDPAENEYGYSFQRYRQQQEYEPNDNAVPDIGLCFCFPSFLVHQEKLSETQQQDRWRCLHKKVGIEFHH